MKPPIVCTDDHCHLLMLNNNIFVDLLSKKLIKPIRLIFRPFKPLVGRSIIISCLLFNFINKMQSQLEEKHKQIAPNFPTTYNLHSFEIIPRLSQSINQIKQILKEVPPQFSQNVFHQGSKKLLTDIKYCLSSIEQLFTHNQPHQQRHLLEEDEYYDRKGQYPQLERKCEDGDLVIFSNYLKKVNSWSSLPQCLRQNLEKMENFPSQHISGEDCFDEIAVLELPIEVFVSKNENLSSKRSIEFQKVLKNTDDLLKNIQVLPVARPPYNQEVFLNKKDENYRSDTMVETNSISSIQKFQQSFLKQSQLESSFKDQQSKVYKDQNNVPHTTMTRIYEVPLQIVYSDYSMSQQKQIVLTQQKEGRILKIESNLYHVKIEQKEEGAKSQRHSINQNILEEELNICGLDFQPLGDLESIQTRREGENIGLNRNKRTERSSQNLGARATPCSYSNRFSQQSWASKRKPWLVSQFSKEQKSLKAPKSRRSGADGNAESEEKRNLFHVQVLNNSFEDYSEGQNTNRSHQKYLNIQLDSNNLDHHDYCFKEPELKNSAELAQYFELKESKMCLEEQKGDLLEQIKQSAIEIQFLQKEIYQKDKKMIIVRQHSQKQIKQLQDKIQRAENLLSQLYRQLEGTKNMENSLRKKLMLSETLIEEARNQMHKKEICISELSDQFKILEDEFVKELQKLKIQIEEKDQIIEEMKDEFIYDRSIHDEYAGDLKEENKRYEEQIFTLSKKLERKSQEIDILKTENKEMAKNLEEACLIEYTQAQQQPKQDSQISAHSNIVKKTKSPSLNSTLEKIQATHRQQIEGKNQIIAELENDNHKVLQELSECLHSLENNRTILKQHQNVIDDLREDLEIHQIQILKLKAGGLAKEVHEEVEFLRRQVQDLGKRLKDEQASALQTQRRNKEQRLESCQKLTPLHTQYLKQKVNVTTQTITIEERSSELEECKESQMEVKSNNALDSARILHKKPPISIEFCQIEEMEEYCHKLQNIIRRHQQVISVDLTVIKELQNRIEEYLGDAIQKEKECDQLTIQLENMEIDLHTLLQEKIAVEIENKRMKKMIAASERKISAIGSRLIHAAKDQLKEDSGYEGRVRRKSQNSTIKLRREE